MTVTSDTPHKFRILLTGPTGQVGFELQRRLASIGEVVALDRSQLDISDSGAIRKVFSSVRPNIVVNAAAYTAVDRAESEPKSAMQVNGTAPGVLAELAKQQRAVFVHYSTDYVFDGKKGSPYTESDATGPLNQYGISKLAGENGILDVGGAYFILRTSWVYSPRGTNFFLKMLQIGRERDELRVVQDQVGSPTSASVVADATMSLLAQCGRSFDETCRFAGIYHATCSGETSWFEFARAIFDSVRAADLVNLKVCRVSPISTSEFPTPAQRPRYSVLSCRKISQACSFRPPEWKDELSRVIAHWAGHGLNTRNITDCIEVRSKGEGIQ